MNVIPKAKAQAKADAACAKAMARALEAKAAAYAKAGLPQQRYVVDYVPVDVNGNRAPPVQGDQAPGPVEGVQPREVPVARGHRRGPIIERARAVVADPVVLPEGRILENIQQCKVHIRQAQAISAQATRGIKRLLDSHPKQLSDVAPVVLEMAAVTEGLDAELDACMGDMLDLRL